VQSAQGSRGEKPDRARPMTGSTEPSCSLVVVSLMPQRPVKVARLPRGEDDSKLIIGRYDHERRQRVHFEQGRELVNLQVILADVRGVPFADVANLPGGAPLNAD